MWDMAGRVDSHRRSRALAGAAVALALALGLAPAAPAAIGPFEPNDSTLAAAGPLALGQPYEASLETANDADFYYFYVTSPGESQVALTVANLGGGATSSVIDATIVDAAATPWTPSHTSPRAPRTVTLTLPPQKYFVEVVTNQAFNTGSGSAYRLTPGGDAGAFGPYAQISGRCARASKALTRARRGLSRARGKLQRTTARLHPSSLRRRQAQRAARRAQRKAERRVRAKRQEIRAAKRAQRPGARSRSSPQPQGTHAIAPARRSSGRRGGSVADAAAADEEAERVRPSSSPSRRGRRGRRRGEAGGGAARAEVGAALAVEAIGALEPEEDRLVGSRCG